MSQAGGAAKEAAQPIATPTPTAAVPEVSLFSKEWLMKRQPPNNLMHMANMMSSVIGVLGVFTGFLLWNYEQTRSHECGLTEQCVHRLNGAEVGSCDCTVRTVSAIYI